MGQECHQMNLGLLSDHLGGKKSKIFVSFKSKSLNHFGESFRALFACGYPLRPSPTWSKVPAYTVDCGGTLVLPPGAKGDDDDGGVVLWAVLQRLKNTHCLSLTYIPLNFSTVIDFLHLQECLSTIMLMWHPQFVTPESESKRVTWESDTCWVMTSAASVGSWHCVMTSQISWSLSRKLTPSLVRAKKESLACWICGDKRRAQDLMFLCSCQFLELSNYRAKVGWQHCDLKLNISISLSELWYRQLILH